MSRKPKQQLPTRKSYQRASSFNTATPIGRAQLWHERLGRAKEMLRIDARKTEIAKLDQYINGTYSGGDEQLYLNEALPAIEDVIFGTLPSIPPVTVEARQEGQEDIAKMGAALIDANLSSGLARTMGTTIQVLWDDIRAGIGISKTAWHSEQVSSSYRPSTDVGAIAVNIQEAEAENLDIAQASVDSDDDHMVHVARHEAWIAGVDPAAPLYMAMLSHIAAHYDKIGRRNMRYLVNQRVDWTKFLYDPDAEEWEDRVWEAELCTEYLSDLERIPGIRNLNPENCPSVDEFENETENWRKDASFDFENTQIEVYKIHDRRNGGYVILPARWSEATKPLWEGDWPYGSLEIYRPLVSRPIPGQVNGYSTLGLIAPILQTLAKLNKCFIQQIRKSAAAKMLTPRGKVTPREASDINNPNLMQAEVAVEVAQLMKEFKPPSLPRDTWEIRELFLAELRRMLGSDIMDQGGDTPHKITATEASVRSTSRERRINRRQQLTSDLLTWVAGNVVLMYREFADEDLAVRVAGPTGVDVKRLRPSSLPEDLICKIDLEAATEAKRAEDTAAALQYGQMMSTMAQGMYDPIRYLVWLGSNRFNIRNPQQFFTPPGQAPLVPQAPGMTGVPGAQPMPGAQMPPQAPPQPQPQLRIAQPEPPAAVTA
ncbi:MAG: hypothetical protein PHU85_11130 [Phycisphaerae bacterium]|nr:hypothetical protein [Phycisphaerae bacterium]